MKRKLEETDDDAYLYTLEEHVDEIGPDGEVIEVWRAVRDAPEYEVSNKARVRNRNTGRDIKPREWQGYMHVGLFRDANDCGREKKYMKVHTLVARAFVQRQRTDQVTVNHKHGKNADRANWACNLEWASRKEQQHHARHILHAGRAPRGVNMHDHNGKELVWFANADVAAEWLGISRQSVSGLCVNTRGSNTGYVLTYDDEVDQSKIDWTQYKPVKDFETSYLVGPTTENTIWGIKRRSFLKIATNVNYPMVHLTRTDGYVKTVPVHAIVATAHCIRPSTTDADTRLVVDHIDSNPRNWAASNLRWVTDKQNTEAACAIEIDQMCLWCGQAIKTWTSISEAARNVPNAFDNAISKVSRGSAKTCGGFGWRKHVDTEADDDRTRLPCVMKCAPKTTRVDCVCLTCGRRLGTYDDGALAAAAVGGCHKSIHAVYSGQRVSHRGFSWRRTDTATYIESTEPCPVNCVPQ